MFKGIIPCMALSAGMAMASLSGYVKLPDGSAVVGAQVTQASTKKTAVTDSKGFFDFAASMSVKAANSSFGMHLSAGTLHLDLQKGALVQISTFTLQGNRVYGQNRYYGAGSFEISAGENLAAGMYLLNVKIGDEIKVYKVRQDRHGVGACSPINSRTSLKKALSKADTLSIVFENQKVGKVAVYDDDIMVDDIVISHKMVTGSTDNASVAVSFESSEGDNESVAATVIGNAYTATSAWTLYKGWRTWNIKAGNKTKSNVEDSVQNVVIDLSAANGGSGGNSGGESALKVTNLTFSAKLDFSSSDYTAATIDLGASDVANALGISTSALSGVTYYAVNADGTLDSNSTANAPGHWFDGNGNVTTYGGGSAMLYSELDLASMKATVGQYPDKLTVGKTYSVKQAVRSGNSIVYFSISLTITGSAAASSSSAPASSSSEVKSSSSSPSTASNYTIQDMYKEAEKTWKFVDWTWNNRLAAGKLDQIENYKNLIFHQIIEGKGSLNFCVRWQSNKTLSAANRKNTVVMLNSMINGWVKELAGFENWPYDKVTVKVVGWAADNASKFPDATSDEKIFTKYTESDGSNPTLPRCPDACARPLHYAEKNYNYSTCEIGERFDMSLWMTDGFNGGAGGDWGQRGSTDAFLSYVTSPNNFPHIPGHEAGHGFGLPDFYETYQIPDASYSNLPCSDYGSCEKSGYDGKWENLDPMVMWAGSATTITKPEAWLLRMVWHHIKGQFGY